MDNTAAVGRSPTTRTPPAFGRPTRDIGQRQRLETTEGGHQRGMHSATNATADEASPPKTTHSEADSALDLSTALLETGDDQRNNQDVILPDYDIDDEGYAQSTSTSYVSSIASDIRAGIEENGRLYPAYGMHKAWLPIDDAESDRNDLQHCKFTLLMENKLHLAPIAEHPQNILDIGTGSGIWAMNVADMHPGASVIGVDIAPIQPTLTPPNLYFEIDDVENEWLWPPNHFDLIHGRELIMAIRDWPRLIRQSFRCLKPGTGYLHLSASVPDFQSDDGTLPPGSAYIEMGRIYFEMSERVGVSGKEPLRWKQYLEDAGYVDVVERVFKIPTNPWPKDERLKRIGAFELAHFREGIANVFARGYTDILGGDPVYFEVLLARARREVADREMHSWVPFYVVYGRKPEVHTHV